MDTYKITAYNKDTGIAVVTFIVGGKEAVAVKSDSYVFLLLVQYSSSLDISRGQKN